MSDFLPHRESILDIFLQPSEFYFGDENCRIRTLLGSCVAITMWHPRLLIGGMCHYMLPVSYGDNKTGLPDGRYADQAIKLFMAELYKSRSSPSEYEVKMFGGGNQFPRHSKGQTNNIPSNNINIGRQLLKKYGFKLKAEHLGGTGHRNIIFDIYTGQVWVKHVAYQHNDLDVNF